MAMKSSKYDLESFIRMQSQGFLLTFTNERLEVQFKSRLAPHEKVHWDVLYFIFGISSGLITLREGLGKPFVGIGLLGPILALMLCTAALVFQHTHPAIYAAYRDTVLVFVKATSMLSFVTHTSTHEASGSGIAECFSFQALLLAAQCLAKNQVLRHVLAAVCASQQLTLMLPLHALLTAISISGNSGLCQSYRSDECERSGALPCLLSGLLLNLSSTDDIHMVSRESCMAIHATLQIMLGFLLPATLCYLWEARARAEFLERRGVVYRMSNLADNLGYLLVLVVQLQFCPLVFGVASYITGA